MAEVKRKTNKRTLIIAAAALVVIIIAVLIVVLTRAKPAAFELSGLKIIPEQTQAGQPVTIQATVANTGGSLGAYTAELKINGALKDTQDIAVNAGGSQLAVFIVVEDAAGTCNVELGGLTGQFTVTQPAAFKLTGLTITPAIARKGQPVNITVTVVNTGGITGSYDAILKIDSLAAETKTVSLASGEDTQVAFTLTRDTPAEYDVKIGDLSGVFTVRPTELRTWVITDADIPRLFSQISSVELTAHFIPGNQAEFVMAGFPGIVDVGIVQGKLCEYPVGAEIYLLLPEIHQYIFFVDGIAYLSYTWFDPAVEIAPDVTEIPVMISVTTEDGQANVIYEW